MIIPQNCYIGKIVYGADIIKKINRLHYEIALSDNALLTFKRLFYWRSFIKSSDYSDEEEVRILFKDGIKSKRHRINSEEWYINRFGILSKYRTYQFSRNPFVIKKIILGPKMKEQKVNKIQLETFLKANMLSNIVVDISEKDNYR